MYISLHVKYLLVLSFLNNTSDFWTHFRKIFKLSNFTEILPRGTESFYADGQTGGRTDRKTDIRKLIVLFHYFVNSSENTPILR